MVLDVASGRNGDVAVGFEDELRGLADSPNFAVRVIAQRVAQRIGMSLPILRPESATASSLYELSLPPGRETGEVWRDSSRTESDFLPETDDPYELLKIQLVELEWAASQAGLPKENVVQRAAQIARELTQEDEWAVRGEQWLRNRFDPAGLKYSYRRPRATIARRAFFHVVAELADAGRLEDTGLREMKPSLDYYYDPEMFFVKPIARPEFVFPMPGGRYRDAVAATGGGEGGDGLPLLRTADGQIIFGEYTKIKRLEWETPTVIRQSLISAAPPNEKEGRHSFFPRKIFCLIQNYTRLRVRRSLATSLVIRQEGRMYDSPGPAWMAFNPELARAVGWTRVTDQLFGWADENGRLMVWSVWWQDGLYQEQPPKFADDVGEGWAVIGSSEALEIITARIGKQLTQYIRIEESHRESGQRRSGVKKSERLIDGDAVARRVG